MAKSSIHIKPIKSNSENHNLRKVDLDYVRKDLSHLNKSYINISIEDSLKELRKLVKDKTGRKMQSKATPIREGVFLFNENHSNNDIVRASNGFYKKFGIKPIQLHIHRDEGHFCKKTNNWKPNFHAHIIFEWVNRETGKSFKLNSEDMCDLQTYIAEALKMERGKSSSKKHLEAIQFKALKNQFDRNHLKKEVTDLSLEANKLKKMNQQLEMDNVLNQAVESLRRENKYIDAAIQREVNTILSKKNGVKKGRSL